MARLLPRTDSDRFELLHQQIEFNLKHCDVSSATQNETNSAFGHRNCRSPRTRHPQSSYIPRSHSSRFEVDRTKSIDSSGGVLGGTRRAVIRWVTFRAAGGLTGTYVS